MQAEIKESNTSGKLTLILLMIFFALPVIIVVAMHLYQVHPKGSSNGQLFSPAIPITLNNGFVTSSGKQIDQAFWGSRWNLVYVAEQCGQACEARVHEVRQIHTSLAKEIERAQRVLIASQANVDALKKQYPDLLIINQAEAVASLSKQFSQHSKAQQGLYFVDPLGHLVMFYADDMPAKLIRADLLKLLKYSWAG